MIYVSSPFHIVFWLLGDVIFDMKDIGSGICLTMICSNVCEIQNKTDFCPTSVPTTTPTITPTTPWVPTCPEWDVMVRIFIYLAHYCLSLSVTLSSKVIILLVQQKTCFLMYLMYIMFVFLFTSAKWDVLIVQLYNGQMYWEQHNWNSSIWVSTPWKHHLCQWTESSSCVWWIPLLPTLCLWL